jgi:acyl carrier protein
MDQTIKELQAIIRRAIGKKNAEIPVTTPLQEIVTSSLQFVIILGEIERRFKLTVPDEFLDPTKLPNVLAIVQLVERLQGALA